MATTNRQADVFSRILAECEDDYVGLWSIYRQVKEAGLPDPKSYTLSLIRFLLYTRTVEAGVPDAKGGFHAWSLAPSETYHRIRKEWSSLGREPDVGDVVWFTTPSSE